MKEQEKRYLVVIFYKSLKRSKSVKPVWQVIDTHNNCAVIVDDIKSKDNAIKALNKIEKQEKSGVQ